MLNTAPTLDARDEAIKAERLALWNARTGPRVGDYLEMPDGTWLRFTHDWGDTIQTTDQKFGYGSFYFSPKGYCDYSGALNPGIKKSLLEDTGFTRDGPVWFFHHDHHRAHNSVQTTIPCRVWRFLLPPTRQRA